MFDSFQHTFRCMILMNLGSSPWTLVPRFICFKTFLLSPLRMSFIVSCVSALMASLVFCFLFLHKIMASWNLLNATLPAAEEQAGERQVSSKVVEV